MEYFKVFKHSNNIYQIKDALGSLSTIIIGTKKALVVDTCYGIGNLFQEIRKITSLPLIVINSHGHMDHSNGNFQFDSVLIDKDDLDLLKKHNSKEWRINNIETAISLNVLPEEFDKESYYDKREGNINFLYENMIIDLGDISFKVIKTPGHTKGSISLYSSKLKLMIVSDAICQYIWLFMEESTDVLTYINTIKKVLEYDFDYFLVGHAPKLIKKEEMHKYLDVALNIDLAKSNKVSFKHFDKYNSYEFSTNGLYNPNGCGIVFDYDRFKKE